MICETGVLTIAPPDRQAAPVPRPSAPKLDRRGRDPSRRGNPFVGIIVGGFGGFLTYWVGALLAATEDLLAQSPDTLPMTFARPFVTFTAWEISLATAGALLGLLVARY